MLDVHPPHEAAHTWKDFFIHIATIVVGLLIAIGLEQAVERIHEHYELRETREALQQELEANRADVRNCALNWRWEIVMLEADLETMRYLQQHPGTKPADVPAEPRFTNYPCTYSSAVWDAAEKNGITRLMPLAEANKHANRYRMLAGLVAQDLEGWNSLNDAGRYRGLHPDPTTMSPVEADDTVRLLEIAMEKKILEGDSLGLLHARIPALDVPVSWEEVGRHQLDAGDANPQAWAAAHARMLQRMQAAGYKRDDILSQLAR
jgi:hypothetical protein